MEPNIEKRLKELLRGSQVGSEIRAALVMSLLHEGLIDLAVEESMALIGTKHSAWFLYARAWSHLAKGSTQEAELLLRQAFDLSGIEYEVKGPPAFAFSEGGNPRLLPPFNSTNLLLGGEGVGHFDEAEILGYIPAIYEEDWIELHSDIGRNIREYKLVFDDVCRCIEGVMHHDAETVSTAVDAADIEESFSARGNSFLLLTLSSVERLQMVADTLWRVCADWNSPLSLCEITAYLHYLLEDDEIALNLAETGLVRDEASVISGNVRALVLNRLGRVYSADEQWRETLRLAPDRSATYLVLGHQALCAGGLDPALRYFQEAVLIGDNLPEANRFLTAALDCLLDD